MPKVNERIFRSIVVAGAMLGAPLAAVADGKPTPEATGKPAPEATGKPAPEATGKPVPPKPSPALAKLEADKAALDAKIAEAVTVVEKAASDRDRALATEALELLRLDAKALDARISAEKKSGGYGTIGHGAGTGGSSAPLTSPELAKLETDRKALVRELPGMLSELDRAKDQEARTKVKRRIDLQKSAIDQLDTKITAEKQRLARVRGGGTTRPKGRGFVLA